MPVTARLSRQFYERFGDETTTELVEWLNAVDTSSQSQMREFMELTIARFSAEIRTSFAEQEARFEGKIAQLDAKITTGLARLETRLAWQMLTTLIAVISFVLMLVAQLLRH